MSLQIEHAGAGVETDSFLRRVTCPLMHYSTAYARFLAGAIPGVECHQLVAYDRDRRIAGVLPYAVKRHASHGAVLNSLPFFGSHGGALVHWNS